MITVAVIAPKPGDTTSLYRAYGPFGHLERTNKDIRIVYRQKEDCARWELFQNVDIVFIQRPAEAGYLNSILALKQYGCKIWIDYDDDFTAVNSDNKVYTGFVSEEFQKNLLGCIKQADLITVSTDALGKSIKEKWEKAITITIPNAVDFRWWDSIITTNLPKGDRINWRGLDSHHRDLESVSSPILELHQENPSWIWGFFGWNPWFITDHLGKTFDYYRGPIFAFQKELALSGGKVGIVPLLNNKFNRSKSNIAWIELSLTGHGVVASALPEFFVPGCETYKTPEEFKEKVKLSMSKYDKNVKTSVAFIEANFNLKHWNKKRAQIIESFGVK